MQSYDDDVGRFDTFVSYSREDHADVSRVLQQLIDREKIVAFIDNQLAPGDNWIQAIQKNISLSDTFLLFIRRAPNPWQMRELDIAINQSMKGTGKPEIIPVLLPNVEPGAFLDNPNLAILQHIQAPQFRQSCDEQDVIVALGRAIRKRSRVWISSRAFPRPHDDLPPGFQVDLEGLTDILIGESVYKSNWICIRELIQNARDACSRAMRDLKPGRLPEVVLHIDPSNRYFDIIDFGDGMSSNVLLNSFSLLGKSLNEDYVRRHDIKQSIESPITGKFGIGFVSVFMISDRIEISSRSANEPAHHLTLTRPTLPFVYEKETQCDRSFDDLGTTVRVFLKQELATGSKRLEVRDIVGYYCRHVPSLFLQSGGNKSQIETDWNFDVTLPLFVHEKTDEYEIYLSWATDAFQGVKLSNGGFFVCNLSDELLSSIPVSFVSGEINIAPGFVDLNIARDNVVSNEKFDALLRAIGSNIYQLCQHSMRYLTENDLADVDAAMNIARIVKEKSAVGGQTNVSNAHYVGMAPIPHPIDFFKLYAAALSVYLASKVSGRYPRELRNLSNKILSGKITVVYDDAFSQTYAKAFSTEKVKRNIIAFKTTTLGMQVKGLQYSVAERDFISSTTHYSSLKALRADAAFKRFYSWWTIAGFRHHFFRRLPQLVFGALAAFGLAVLCLSILKKFS